MTRAKHRHRKAVSLRRAVRTYRTHASRMGWTVVWTTVVVSFGTGMVAGLVAAAMINLYV